MINSVRTFEARLQASRTLCRITVHARRTPAAASVRAVTVAVWVKAGMPNVKVMGDGVQVQGGGSQFFVVAVGGSVGGGVGGEQGIFHWAHGVSCGVVWLGRWGVGNGGGCGWSQSGWACSRGRRCTTH
jgi:hypothetical protein